MNDDEEFSREERKRIYKEALKEWLNECAQKFGWWSFRMLSYLALCAIVYIILWSHGWKFH